MRLDESMKILQFVLVFLVGVVVGYALTFFPRPEVLEVISGVQNTEGTVETNEPDRTTDASGAEAESYELQKPIPLRDLPLSDSQKKTAATFGIDVETFVITPAMLGCAEGKLGGARLEAIIGGSSPSFTESLSLMGCLSAG